MIRRIIIAISFVPMLFISGLLAVSLDWISYIITGKTLNEKVVYKYWNWVLTE